MRAVTGAFSFQLDRKPQLALKRYFCSSSASRSGGRAPGWRGSGVGVGHAAGGQRFDGGNGGEDLEDLLSDGDSRTARLRRVGLQLDGGGVAVGEQLDEERPGELRHGGRDAGAEQGEPAIDIELGALPEERREGLGAFGDLGSQGGQLGFSGWGGGLDCPAESAGGSSSGIGGLLSGGEDVLRAAEGHGREAGDGGAGVAEEGTAGEIPAPGDGMAERDLGRSAGVALAADQLDSGRIEVDVAHPEGGVLEPDALAPAEGGAALVVVEVEARHLDGWVVGGGHLFEALRGDVDAVALGEVDGDEGGELQGRGVAGGRRPARGCDRRQGSRGRSR